MRNKQDITDYKKLWIASYLAMTGNRAQCNRRNVRWLSVIARHEAIQKVQLLYVINSPSHKMNCTHKKLTVILLPIESESFPIESESFPIESESFPIESESFPIEPESFPIEPESFPIEPESFPIEPEPFPIEPEPFPIESEPFPIESESFPIESEPFPIESESFPIESASCGLKQSKSILQSGYYTLCEDLTDRFKSGYPKLEQVFTAQLSAQQLYR